MSELIILEHQCWSLHSSKNAELTIFTSNMVFNTQSLMVQPCHGIMVLGLEACMSLGEGVIISVYAL